MSAVETQSDDLAEAPGPDPAAKVLGWRIEQLIAAGFDSDAAFVLALDRNVDLHEAIKLVGRGCPPATALRILI
jgi:rRNA processing protein Krr1/Pno1